MSWALAVVHENVVVVSGIPPFVTLKPSWPSGPAMFFRPPGPPGPPGPAGPAGPPGP